MSASEKKRGPAARGTSPAPFDWMEAKRNPAHTRTLGAKRAAMVRTELGERAALLHRLWHSEADTRARLESTVRWEADHPGGAPAAAAADIDAALERAFRGAATPSRAKR